MTTTEIKKLYTKTKKAVEKKTGDKFTWVMNGRQQQLGTATVCVACSYDTVQSVAYAREQIESGKVEKEARRTWRSFKRDADEEAITGGGTWNPTFWRDHLAEMGTEDEYAAKLLQRAHENLAKAEKKLETLGDMANQIKTAHKYAQELIASTEIQSFLAAIGGSATIEDKLDGCLYTYIRFHYRADDVVA